LSSAQTRTHRVTYVAIMYHRDLTRAAPIVQREIDLSHTAATGDAHTMYLWCMTLVAHRHTQYIRGQSPRQSNEASLGAGGPNFNPKCLG